MMVLVGCGDDNSGNPDAPKADAAPDTAGPTFKGFDADEGGEVRLEYVRFAGGNAATRVTSFFYKDAGSKKFYPFLDLNGCTDMSTKMFWPMAQNPVGERVYMNPGQVLISGGPQVLSVDKRTMAGNDPFGRNHPADQWFFHFQGSTGTDGPTYTTEKTRYDVTLTGSADMPAQIFDDVIFMPADFPLTTPGVAPFPIPAGTPQTFTWSNVPSGEPMGYEVQSLVGFTGANGPVVLCVEKNDGSITVPAAMIDIVRAKYPTGGTLARQTPTHVVRELVDRNGPTGKRIDFLGVWCYATAFTVP
jgi:hypothetical protein